MDFLGSYSLLSLPNQNPRYVAFWKMIANLYRMLYYKLKLSFFQMFENCIGNFGVTVLLKAGSMRELIAAKRLLRFLVISRLEKI